VARSSMLDHEEVVAFAEEIRTNMPDHDHLKEVPVSRVALLSRTDDTWVPKLRKDSDFWARDPVTGD